MMTEQIGQTPKKTLEVFGAYLQGYAPEGKQRDKFDQVVANFLQNSEDNIQAIQQQPLFSMLPDLVQRGLVDLDKSIDRTIDPDEIIIRLIEISQKERQGELLFPFLYACATPKENLSTREYIFTQLLVFSKTLFINSPDSYMIPHFTKGSNINLQYLLQYNNALKKLGTETLHLLEFANAEILAVNILFYLTVHSRNILISETKDNATMAFDPKLAFHTEEIKTIELSDKTNLSLAEREALVATNAIAPYLLIMGSYVWSQIETNRYMPQPNISFTTIENITDIIFNLSNTILFPQLNATYLRILFTKILKYQFPKLATSDEIKEHSIQIMRTLREEAKVKLSEILQNIRENTENIAKVRFAHSRGLKTAFAFFRKLMAVGMPFGKYFRRRAPLGAQAIDSLLDRIGEIRRKSEISPLFYLKSGKEHKGSWVADMITMALNIIPDGRDEGFIDSENKLTNLALKILESIELTEGVDILYIDSRWLSQNLQGVAFMQNTIVINVNIHGQVVKVPVELRVYLNKSNNEIALTHFRSQRWAIVQLYEATVRILGQQINQFAEFTTPFNREPDMAETTVELISGPKATDSSYVSLQIPLIGRAGENQVVPNRAIAILTALIDSGDHRLKAKARKILSNAPPQQFLENIVNQLNWENLNKARLQWVHQVCKRNLDPELSQNLLQNKTAKKRYIALKTAVNLFISMRKISSYQRSTLYDKIIKNWLKLDAFECFFCLLAASGNLSNNILAKIALEETPFRHGGIETLSTRIDTQVINLFIRNQVDLKFFAVLSRIEEIQKFIEILTRHSPKTLL